MAVALVLVHALRTGSGRPNETSINKKRFPASMPHRQWADRSVLSSAPQAVRFIPYFLLKKEHTPSRIGTIYVSLFTTLCPETLPVVASLLSLINPKYGNNKKARRADGMMNVTRQKKITGRITNI